MPNTPIKSNRKFSWVAIITAIAAGLVAIVKVLPRLQEKPSGNSTVLTNSSSNNVVSGTGNTVTFNPSAKTQEPLPTDKYYIYTVTHNGPQVKVDSFAFPYSDIQKNADPATLEKAVLRQLPSLLAFKDHKIRVFRRSDEVELIPGSSQNALSQNNPSVIVFVDDVLGDFGDVHVAFTRILDFVHEFEKNQR